MANNKPSVRASSGKVFWKLAPVFVGIIAYFGLGAIENAKNNYDQEQAAPTVITDQTNREKKNIFEIGIGDIQGKLATDSWNQLGKYINKIKFRPFKNENELDDALNEQVLAEKAASERKYQYRREALNMNYAAERLPLFKRQGEIETILGGKVVGIREKLDKAGAGKKLQPSCFPSPTSDSSSTADKVVDKSKMPDPLPLCKPLQEWETLMTQIVDLEKNYQKEQLSINDALLDLDIEAQGKAKSIYLNLNAALASIKADIKSGKPPESAVTQGGSQPAGSSSLKNFNFQSVLDDNHGIHVIYQVFRLILIVLLVFGIISVGLALLRLFPSYASGSEALTDQAKTFLSRNSSVAPNIARAAVISVAAIGIGTAVVVAGNSGSGQSSLALSNNASGSVTQNNQRQEKNTDGTDSTDVGTRVIPMPYPVPYPSPITVQAINNNVIPSPDEKVIKGLTTGLEGLRTQVNGISEDISRNVKDPLTKLDWRVTGYDVPGLITKTNDLTTGVDHLNDMAATLRTDFFTKLAAVSNKLDTSNSTMIGIRNDSLIRLQRPEGRNFLTRVKHFFNPTERYFVSAQAYAVLENLLCTAPVKDAAGNPQCPNSALLDKLSYLKNDSTQQPRTEKELLSALGGEDSAYVKPWKSIILRYTRIP